MGAEPSLSTVDKLLYLGRVSWPHATVPVALRRLSVAAEHMRQRAFERGRELAREGEPMASCYLLVRGRLRVSRRGVALGEVEPGSLVGLEALLSQDQMGLGVVAATDVLALQLDADTLVGILGDQFPLVHQAISGATRRLLALVRRLAGPSDDSTLLLGPRPAGRLMSLVEVLLHMRTPGSPFERSSIDALAELAATAAQVPFRPGQVLWRQGEAARRLGFIVDGSVACTASLDDTTSSFRLGPGRPLGVLEALAGELRWHDAVAEAAGVLIELDVEDLIDMFEDNVDIALDYLAWLSRSTLALIESRLGPGGELLEFFTTPTASPLAESRKGAVALVAGGEP
jgi:CRP-like cAMP-binding protein